MLSKCRQEFSVLNMCAFEYGMVVEMRAAIYNQHKDYKVKKQTTT